MLFIDSLINLNKSVYKNLTVLLIYCWTAYIIENINQSMLYTKDMLKLPRYTGISFH